MQLHIRELTGRAEKNAKFNKRQKHVRDMLESMLKKFLNVIGTSVYALCAFRFTRYWFGHLHWFGHLPNASGPLTFFEDKNLIKKSRIFHFGNSLLATECIRVLFSLLLITQYFCCFYSQKIIFNF